MKLESVYLWRTTKLKHSAQNSNLVAESFTCFTCTVVLYMKNLHFVFFVVRTTPLPLGSAVTPIACGQDRNIERNK